MLWFHNWYPSTSSFDQLPSFTILAQTTQVGKKSKFPYSQSPVRISVWTASRCSCTLQSGSLWTASGRALASLSLFSRWSRPSWKSGLLLNTYDLWIIFKVFTVVAFYYFNLWTLRLFSDTKTEPNFSLGKECFGLSIAEREVISDSLSVAGCQPDFEKNRWPAFSVWIWKRADIGN